MDDFLLDDDLKTLDQHLVSLSRRVEPDPSHYAQLRLELLRRHRELRTDTTQRAVPTLWSRLTGLKRLTLVAPPALAAAIVLYAVFSGVQITGHQSPQMAEAAQITQALSRTAPTVTAWQVNLQYQRGNSAGSVNCQPPLKADEHFFVRDGGAYFYSGGKWYRVSATFHGGTAQCPLDIMWAFVILPAHLQQNQFTVLPGSVIGGHRTEGIRYSARRGQTLLTTTEWVDRTTGLVRRAERLIRRNSKVVERDVADYSYQRS